MSLTGYPRRDNGAAFDRRSEPAQPQGKHLGRAGRYFERRRHACAASTWARFDDFVSQVLHPEGDRIGLPTLFFPMLRIERIALDEARGSIPSMAGNVREESGPLAGGLSRSSSPE